MTWWMIPLLLLPMLPTFWSIWDIWSHSFVSYNRKMAWLALAVFVPVLGGIIYILFGRKEARKGDRALP